MKSLSAGASTDSPRPVPITGWTGGTGIVAFSIEELSIGGAERMLVAMANEFVRLGWQVHMVCLRKAGVLAADLHESIIVHVLHKRPGADPGLILRLNRCIRRIDPMVVNSHLWVANTWTRIALLNTRIPLVATEHSRDTWKPRYYLWIDRLLSRRTAALVAVSGDTAGFYRDTVGLDSALIKVINNGVDTRRFAAGNGAALRSTWLDGSAGWRDLPPDRRILIGTVGRFVVAKNHRRLVDVLTMLQADPALAGYQLRLVLVGDGEGRCDLEAYVQQQGVQASVIFAGMRQDIPDVLDALDLFVLSSDREGHPLTALEAQAAGTPVVLTDAGGSCEAIAHEAGQSGGVLVEKTAEALTRAIREMILKPELRMQRGTFARSYALEHFDKQQMAQRYADIFLDIGGHSRG